MTTVISACGGGGGSGDEDTFIDDTAIPDPSTVSEGSGPVLDLTNIQSIKDLIRAVVLSKNYEFFQDNAEPNLDSEEQRTEFCLNGSMEKEINYSPDDTTSLIGSIILQIINSLTLEGSSNAILTYDDHGFTIEATAENITLDGGANYTLAGTISVTGKTITSVFCEETSPESLSLITDENMVGSYTISGDIGGAIVFTLRAETTISGNMDNSAEEKEVLGTAIIKSGGETIECTITKSGTGTDYSIDC